MKNQNEKKQFECDNFNLLNFTFYLGLNYEFRIKILNFNFYKYINSKIKTRIKK